VLVPLVTKKQWSALKMRAALRSRGRHRAGVVEQLAEFLHRVAHVGAQHVLAEELVEHLPHRALQEGHAAGVARAVPGVRAVLRVVHQRLEERRRQRSPGSCCASRMMWRATNSGVSSNMWMKPCSSRRMSLGMCCEVRGLAVQVDRDVGVLASGSPR
jgi:hypothetical protein